MNNKGFIDVIMISLSGKVFFITVVFLLILGSCTPVVKTFYGIRKPAVENEQSIRKYAKKKGLAAERIVCFGREDWFWIIQDQKIGNTIPDMILFDKECRLLKIREEDQCNAMNEDVISSLDPGKQFDINESLVLAQVHPKRRTLTGEPVNIEKIDNADFTIYVFWTKYTGRLNKTKTLMWQNEIQSNTNCKIEFFLVNMDQQQWWDER
jgi:hypothetical protein